MQKYAIFIDIDGTLFDGKTIHPENIRAINEAAGAGHFVFINTGRGYSFIPAYIRDAANFYGIVAGIGAHIVIGSKTVKSITFEKDDLKQAFSLLKVSSCTVRYQGEQFFYYQNNSDYNDGGTLLTSEDDIEKFYGEMKISKFTCFNPKPGPEIVEFFKARHSVVEYGHCIEITSKGQNKAVGMLDAAKIVGAKRQNCIAMGDSENDLDMLKAAGISVAMHNAPDDIKKICDFVSVSCSDGGVAHAIDKLVLKK